MRRCSICLVIVVCILFVTGGGVVVLFGAFFVLVLSWSASKVVFCELVFVLFYERQRNGTQKGADE